MVARAPPVLYLTRLEVVIDLEESSGGKRWREKDGEVVIRVDLEREDWTAAVEHQGNAQTEFHCSIGFARSFPLDVGDYQQTYYLK
jgi:hypothetical protein